MNLGLNNKIVVLTGATGGIGQQICLEFIQEGAHVVCLFRNEKKVEDLIDRLKVSKADLNSVSFKKTNLLHKNNIREVVSEIVKEKGRIDVLVNCAGNVVELPFAMMSEEQIDQMYQVNLKTMMLLTQAILKPMFSQKSGSIVNVSSIAALRGGRGITAYSSMKAGIDSFTRTLALEVGRKNIRVNAVRPGGIKTKISEPLESRAEKYIPEIIILSRFGTPEEVSKGVLFLASDATASYITGTCLNIDGGYLV